MVMGNLYLQCIDCMYVDDVDKDKHCCCCSVNCKDPDYMLSAPYEVMTVKEVEE